MIGVIADPAEHKVVREFFELFKTPWEFYRREARYEVVLIAGDQEFEGTAPILVVYAGQKTRFDGGETSERCSVRMQPFMLSYGSDRIPIYGDCVAFPITGAGFLKDEDSQGCVGYETSSSEGTFVRIGYDLFREIRHLLTAGQPVVNAQIPTLELHIALLRDVIIGCGVSLVEIPPVPDGYSFIACLTHDVDHPSLRAHKWDGTALGFLFRAALFCIWDFVRARITFGELFKNWAAALKLPFVYLGLAADPWSDFAERYSELEDGIPSSYFVIPVKNYSGKSVDRRAALLRASGYEAKEIANTIRRLVEAGCEVGLHGIDAWIDSTQGRAEIEEIRRLTGVDTVGVRMHWLYYNCQSPAVLEETGAAYDSTVGYNETVGYRAGTLQAYKTLQAVRLLELPLHVMDTALFYQSYLSLSPRGAAEVIERMVGDVTKFGGCLTVNWHDRSLAPERLWHKPYKELVQNLKKQGACFLTAAEAVSWFEKRRAARFEMNSEEFTAGPKFVSGNDLPGLRLRTYSGRSSSYVDVSINEKINAAVC